MSRLLSTGSELARAARERLGPRLRRAGSGRLGDLVRSLAGGSGKAAMFGGTPCSQEKTPGGDEARREPADADRQTQGG